MREIHQTLIWTEHTSIDENALAGDVSRLGTGEETDDVGDVFWFLHVVVNDENLPSGKGTSYLRSLQSRSSFHRLLECFFWTHSGALRDTGTDLFPHLIKY